MFRFSFQTTQHKFVLQIQILSQVGQLINIATHIRILLLLLFILSTDLSLIHI